MDQKARGIIQDQLALAYNEETGAAFASDTLILHFDGKPAAATLTENTEKKQVFRWSVQMVNRSGQTTNMRYRAALIRTSGQVLVHAQPAGYGNNFTARGKCAVTNMRPMGLG